MIKIKKYNWFIFHLLFWLFFIALSNFLEYIIYADKYVFGIIDAIITQLPNICTVYLCVALCKKFINPLKPFWFIFGIFIVFQIAFWLWYVISYHIRPYIVAAGPAPKPFNYLHFGASVLWGFIRYSVWGFGYYFASEGIKREKQLRLVEKEKHETEYAFLRAQINPHFLNNTLNYLYIKSIPLSDHLANSILTLSEIMHYSLEINDEDETVWIDQEIDHIKNVIKINQLRFSNKLQINLRIDGETHNIRIIPLILITIVENMLKHGNATDIENPIKFHLEIDEPKNHISLKTWNKKKKGPKEVSSEIGMVNIQRRLMHHYVKNFILSVQETETDYSLELILPINKMLMLKGN